MDYNSTNFYLKSRNDYYEECLFPKNSKRYQDFIDLKENSIITSKNITFRDIPFLENEKNVINSFGKPRFVLENPYPFLPVKVIFYKEKIENFRVIIQVHFFENKFFYACYTFRKCSKKDLSFFKEIIFNKYLDKTSLQMLGGSQDPSEISSIVDSNQNGLIIMPDVHLHFIYFSENNEIAKRLQSMEMNQRELNQEASKILNEKFAGKYF